jgi:GNAT superfamily N-acetyltransferase
MDGEAITVVRATPEQLPVVLRFVQRLLMELSDDPAEFDDWDPVKVRPALEAAADRFIALLAQTPEGQVVGVATLTEAVAAYAHGRYGIISELYVVPSHRSHGVGQQLIDAVKDYGRERGWRRVDVTAPPEARWVRTVDFYRRNGFVFTGPKLRCQLSG